MIKKQFTCLGENTEKSISLTVPIERELIKMEKKLQKIYFSFYSLLIVQDLWQARYQILSIIFLKEFIELNVNSDMMIKNLKHVESNICIATVFWNIYNFKDDLIEYKCLCWRKNYQHKFNEKLKERFFNACKFSNNDNNKFISLLRKSVYPYE